MELQVVWSLEKCPEKKLATLLEPVEAVRLWRRNLLLQLVFMSHLLPSTARLPEGVWCVRVCVCV